MTCCICLEQISDSSLFVTGCNHKFHKKCFLKWCKNVRKRSYMEISCPICRKNVDDDFDFINNPSISEIFINNFTRLIR